MKKSYITPEITFMEADACELLSASINKPQSGAGYSFGGGENGSEDSKNGDISKGDYQFDQHAKPGDLFCDNFEYDFDF